MSRQSDTATAPRGVVHCADGVAVARTLEDESVDFVYLDPPFKTGRRQTREQLRTRRVGDGDGDRTGFGGRSYETERLGSRSFEDSYDDYLGFLEPFIVEAQRLLAPSGGGSPPTPATPLRCDPRSRSTSS